MQLGGRSKVSATLEEIDSIVVEYDTSYFVPAQYKSRARDLIVIGGGLEVPVKKSTDSVGPSGSVPGFGETR